MAQSQPAAPEPTGNSCIMTSQSSGVSLTTHTLPPSWGLYQFSFREMLFTDREWIRKLDSLAVIHLRNSSLLSNTMSNHLYQQLLRVLTSTRWLNYNPVPKMSNCLLIRPGQKQLDKHSSACRKKPKMRTPSRQSSLEGRGFDKLFASVLRFSQNCRQQTMGNIPCITLNGKK